jgi:hypothetical protein
MRMITLGNFSLSGFPAALMFAFSLGVIDWQVNLFETQIGCLAGSWSPDFGRVPCKPCPRGSAAPDPGKTGWM